MATILITGGTGLIGKHLTKKLIDANFEVAILSRNPTAQNEFKWDISADYIDKKAFENITHIIHLAGAGIANKRWTVKRKKEIIDSRKKSTELLFKTVKKLNIPLKKFISASGTGFYPSDTSNKIYKETDMPTDEFLGIVCQEWEKSALQFESIQIPTTIFRTSVVLSKKGGALEKMKTLIISPLGNGKQFSPWIHIDDLCNLYLKAVQDIAFQGIYNAVSLEHHTSTSFSKALAKAFNKPFLSIGVPAFLLKLFLGEMSVLLLQGRKVSSEKTVKNGFSFKFKSLESALEDLK